MKKVFVGMLVLALGSMFSGCSEEPKPDIEEKFRGKWETQSITVTNQFLPGGIRTLTLPATISGSQINSQGYLIDATSIKKYRNGVIIDTVPEVYSQGDSFYGDTNWSMTINGNAAQLFYTDYADNLIKVDTFSWE